jgi:hypothetical protein
MAEDIQNQVIAAVRYARRELHWRPGKAAPHLAKRISVGHLEPGATLHEYEAIIRQVLPDQQAKVYVFYYQRRHYPTLVSDRAGQPWLVMLDTEGRMETAFVVEQPETYFADPRFAFLGEYQESMQ